MLYFTLCFKNKTVNNPCLKQCKGIKKQGFSLLEMVLVLFIIGVLTSISVSFLDDQDHTQRYQQSVTKLKAINRHFLSVDKFQGQLIYSGFLLDNGKISNNNSADFSNNIELITGELNQEEFATYQLREIYIDLAPSPSLPTNLNKEIVTGANLFKGLRPGLYDLTDYKDKDKKILDAWGDGFNIQSNATTVTISIDTNGGSYKASGAEGPLFSTVINKDELEIPVNALPVFVNGLSNEAKTYRVAIVSFHNNNQKTDDDEPSIEILPSCRNNPASCWSSIHSVSVEVSAATTAKYFRLVNQEDASMAISLSEHLDVTQIDESNTTPFVTDYKYTTQSTDSIDDYWVFQPLGENNKFEFSASDPVLAHEKITIGTHMAVLLELNTEETPSTWQVYRAVNPVFTRFTLLPNNADMIEPIILEVN